MSRHSSTGTIIGRDGAKRTLLTVLMLIAGILTITTLPSVAPPAAAAIQQDFVASFNAQQNGAITVTGNSQMTCPAATACTTARNTVPTANQTTGSNNDFAMQFVDNDGNTTTTNSTSAGLTLAGGSTVLYANLSWGARRTAGTSGVAATGNANQIKFRVPGGAYQTLTAPRSVSYPTLNGTPYNSSLDVTALVKAAGNGTYWAADISAATGADRYAGWSLTVVYQNPAFPLRDLRVYEGFADVSNGAPVTIPITGLLTPPAGTVNASVGFVVWEGDAGFAGDSASLVSAAGVSSPLSDASRPTANFFDSAISDLGTNLTNRDPAYVNNLGVDIGRVNANGLIPNGATQTNLQLTSSGDVYYPTQLTTQIDLYTPAFNAISKTVTNLSGNSPAQPGDTLEYQISFTNTGADFADNAVIRDPLPAGITYSPGTLSVLTGANPGAKTDAAGDDVGSYAAAAREVSFRVGTGATATTGGTLAPNASTSVRFRATVDRAASGTTITNVALLDYRARAINKDYTFTGNAVDTPVRELADLAVTKTSNPTSQNAGNQVTYTVTATNNGPNAAAGVVVTDTLPTGVDYVASNPPAGVTCTNSGRTVTCTASTLANGATLVIPIVVSIPSGSATGSLANTATVSATTADDVTTNNSSTATTTVTRQADVALTKSGTPASAAAGTQVTYTLTATNAGPSSAAGTQIVDQLPAGVTLVSATPSAGTCTTAGTTVTCDTGTIAAGGAVTSTLVVTVNANIAATSVTNSGSVSTTTPETVTSNNSAATTTTVTRSADLQVTKTTTTDTPFVAGRPATFVVAVRNNGPSDAAAVTISDPVPTGYTVTSLASTLGTCSDAVGTTVSCTVGTLASGATATITIRGTISPTFVPGNLSNTASAATTTTDPTAGNNSSTLTVAVVASADLSLSKSADPAQITFGSPVTYTLVVTNNGPSSSAGVATSDPLPAGFVFISGTNCVAAANNTVTCTVGTLTAGATATRSFTVSTPAGGSGNVTNTATVSATTPDPTAANNSASAVSNGVAQSDLSLTKRTVTATPVSGGTLVYELVATNNGPSSATGVVVTDTLPAGISYASSTGAACTPNGQVVTCSVGNLANGAAATIELTTRVGNNTRQAITNSATVAATTNDPTPANNTASSTVTVQAVADVAVTLVPRQTTVTAGTVVTYDLRVVNNGPATANSVVITGAVPPGLTPVAGSSGGACVVSAGTVTCNVGNLPQGQVIPIAFQATVDASTPAGPISGSARVGSTTSDPVPDNNVSNATITVVTRADLATTKTVTPTTLVAGSTATYEVTVTNNGPSDAVGATLTDTVPAGLTPGTPTASVGSCTLTGQRVDCSVARLSTGQVMTVRIPVSVPTDASGTISNTATAASATTDPDATNDAATRTSTVDRSADLQLQMVPDATGVVAGTTVTYTLTVTNAGPSIAAGSAVTDTLPAGLTVLPGGLSTSGGTCTASTDRTGVSCDFGTIPAGESRVVVIEALVASGTAAGTVLTNRASVSGTTADPTPANNTASVDVTVTTSADLRVTKAPASDTPEAGTQHGYTVSVTNNGPSLSRGVVLTDPLPTGTTYVSAISSSGSCTAVDGAIRCAIGDLAAGASATVQITVQLGAALGGRILTNAASATSAPSTGAATPDPTPANDSSTVSQIVSARSDLLLTKTITSGPVVAGQDVTYRVTLANRGPSDAANAYINDAVPAGTTYQSATASGGGSCSTVGAGSDLVIGCTWDTIPNGATRTADITFRVPADLAAGGTVTNTVTGGSDSSDPTPNTATVPGTVTYTADLVTTKTLLSGQPVAGGPVRWQITVVNNGPSTARAVTTTDTVPAALVGTTAQGPTTESCTVTGRDVACTLGDLAPNASVSVVVAGTLSADFGGDTLANTATAATTTPESATDNNTSTSTTPTATQADLSISKTGAPTALVAGSTVTWTITVTNAVGPSTASGVVVTDVIPAGVSAVNGTVPGGTCAVTEGTLRCTVASLAVGASAVVTLTGTVGSGYTGSALSNTAGVTADTPDPDRSNDSASSSNAVGRSSDVAVIMTGPATAAPGSQATWTIVVRNDGPSDATDIRLTDTLPAGVLGVSLVGPSGSCPVTDRTATCSLGALAAGQSVTLTLRATIDPDGGGTLVNSVAVTSGTADPTPANNSASVTTTLVAAADLSIVKDQIGSAVAGRTVSWVLTVDNQGPSTARNVVVTDTVPTAVTGVAASVAGGETCTVTGQQISCTVATLAPGLPDQITVTGTLAADYTGSTLSNTATVGSDTPDGDATDNTSTAIEPVSRSADLSIGKAITSGPPIAGTQVHYLIDVVNDGPSVATSVSVTDPLPAEVMNATATVTAGGSPGSSCTVAAGTISCDLGGVAVGTTVTIDVTGTLAQSVGDRLSNTATVSSSVPDPVGANNTSTATATIGESADLALTITGPGRAVAGADISWSIVVTNNGGSNARGVVLSDLIPAGVGNVVVTLPGGVVCDDPARCVLGTLAPGESVTITVGGRLSAAYSGSSVTDQASVAASTPDPDDRNNSDSTVAEIDRVATFGVTKAAEPTTLVPGRPATYTITVTNDGPSDAPASLLSDALPDGLTVRAPGVTTTQGSCTPVGRQLDCTLGTLPAGSTATITVPVSVDPAFTGSSILNQAIATNPYGPSATGSIESAVTPLADLTVTKTGPATVTAGSPLGWTIKVDNSGPSTARGVVLVDTLPAGVGDVDVTASQGSCVVTDREIRCTIGDLAAGDIASVRVTIDGVLDPSFTGTSLVNTARVSSTTPEPAGVDPGDPTEGGRRSATTTAVRQSADVQLFKVTDLTGVAPGEAVDWSIIVRNNGPSTARDLVVIDTLPAGLLDPEFTAPNGITCTAAGVCDFGDLALLPGADNQVTITVSGTVDPDATGSLIRNSADVEVADDAIDPTPDPIPGNNTDESAIALAAVADVSVTKANGPGPVLAGGPVSWTVVVTNNGPSTARDVVATDTLPSGVSGVEVDGGAPGTCDVTTAEIICTIGDLAPGSAAAVTLTVTATVDPGRTADLTNVVSVVGDTGAYTDPDTANNTATVDTEIGTSADLAVVKSGPPSVTAGGRITWTLRVASKGPSVATDVTLTDLVPNYVSDVTFDAPDGVSCPAGVCALGDVVPGADITVTVTGTVDPDRRADVVNTATVASSTPDPQAADNSDTETTGVDISSDVQISVDAVTTSVSPGERAAWTVTVQNNGPSSARGVTVVDTLPAGLTGEQFTAPNGVTCELVGRVLSCDFGAQVLDPGAGSALQITVSGVVPSDTTATEVVNSATVSSVTPDLNEENDTASASVSLVPSADLSVVKTGPSGPVTAGESIKWTITVTNDGPATARGVTVTDTLPAGVSGIAFAPSAGSCTTAGVCTLGAIAAGRTATVVVSGTVTADYAGDAVTNVAVVDADTADPVGGNNSSSVDTDVDALADLTITKLGPDTVVAGGTIEWTITVTNDGSSLARSVRVNDLTPDGVSGILFTPSVGTCADALCALGDLAPGASATITVTGTVDPDTIGRIENIASTTSDTPDEDPFDQATAITDVTGSADLALTKTVGPDPVVPGQPVTFTLTATNAGPSVARDVVFTDVVSADVTDPTATGIGAVCSTAPAGDGATLVTCTATDPLADAGTLTVTITGILAADVDPGTLSNTASLASGTPDPRSGNNTATVGATTATADLTVRKTADVAEVGPAGTISWTVEVSNAADAQGPARSVVLTDTLPAGVDVTAVTTSAGTCDPVDGRSLSCLLGTITPGSTVIVTITATVDDRRTGTLVNTATALSPDEGVPADNTDRLDVPVTPTADLSFTKTVSPDPVVPGAKVVFTLTATNDGPSPADDVTFTDLVPGTVTHVTAAGAGVTCTETPQGASTLVSCTATGPLADGGTLVVTITGTLDDDVGPGALANSASVSTSTADPDLANNQDTVGTVTATADLSVTKTADVPEVRPGGTIVWTIEVSNAADAQGPARAVDLIDTLPTGIDVTSVTPSAGTCAQVEGQSLVCSLGSIAPGATVTVTVTATVDDRRTGSLTNNVVVSSRDDIDGAGAPVQAITPVTPTADLSLTKTLTPDPLVPGEDVTFTLTATNNGPSPAEDVTFTDVVAGTVSGVTTDDHGVMCSTAPAGDGATVVTCTATDPLADAGTLVVTITGTLDADVDPGALSNTAAVASATFDPTSANNAATAGAATATADLTVSKTADVTEVRPGEAITWTVTVRNAVDAQGPARSIVLTDILPAGIEVTSVTVGPDTAGSCDPVDGRPLVCTLGSLAPGAAVTVTVTATVDDDRTGTLANSASAVSPDESDPRDNTVTLDVPVTDSADVSLTKSVSPDPLVPGGPVKYTLTATNAGPATARDLVFTDVVAGVVDVTHAGGAGVECSSTPQGDDTVVTCTAIGPLADAGSLAVTITGTLDPAAEPGEVSNTAAVTSSTADPDTTNNTATVGAETAQADLSVTKTANVDAVLPGGDITWTIVVRNADDAQGPARSVLLTDALPEGVDVSGVEVSGAQASAGCSDVDGRSLVCSLGSIAPGAAVTVTVTGTLGDRAGGSLVNTVGVLSPDEAAPADNVATVSTPVTPAADLVITKTPATDRVVAGGRLDWTITVRNDGPVDAPDVQITDELPAGLTVDTAALPDGCAAVDVHTVRCSLGTVPDGTTRTIVLRTVVDAGFSGAIENTAVVLGGVADQDPASNTAVGDAVVEAAVPPTTTVPTVPTVPTTVPTGPTTVPTGPTTGPTGTTTVPTGTTTVPTGTTTVPTGTTTGPATSVPTATVPTSVPTGTVPTGTSAPTGTTAPAVPTTGPTTAPTTGPSSPTPPGELPNTGAPVTSLLWWALGLLLAGAGLVLLQRRRRQS
ncbi:LPXTG cell wall anchor domain-containing protein [Nakamurella sp. A5-74]|uniref:LPXTG cell wall anchor domain-containing protein n=1 Tax=Nakamurella sp. A5-74 TaxID=3158264 RepID=A0AAU8DLZ9_9ACTN